MGNVGLNANAPRREGRAQDCYHVANLAAMLCGQVYETLCLHHTDCARHACELVRISGQLHRLAERECNEDLTCGTCGGAGGEVRQTVAETLRDCPKCKGDGRRTGPRKAKLRAAAEEIAAHYGLRCYFQTDPRGCALYLIDTASIPGPVTLGRYIYPGDTGTVTPETLRSRWIDANYTQGHAVTRLGR